MDTKAIMTILYVETFGGTVRQDDEIPQTKKARSYLEIELRLRAQI